MGLGLIGMSMARETDRERAAGGEFSTETTLDEVLRVVELASSPSVMTGEVADELDISDESARQKLLALTENGQVERRKAGRQTLWWVNRERPAVVEVSHDFYTDQVTVTFANGVALTVSYQEESAGQGYTCELTHPDVEAETWGDETIDRSPPVILSELLSDFYNEDEERDTKVPRLDAFMQEVEQ
jgi:DNA-binding transcriptional ArsR family regulator